MLAIVVALLVLACSSHQLVTTLHSDAHGRIVGLHPLGMLNVSQGRCHVKLEVLYSSKASDMYISNVRGHHDVCSWLQPTSCIMGQACVRILTQLHVSAESASCLKQCCSIVVNRAYDQLCVHDELQLIIMVIIIDRLGLR